MKMLIVDDHAVMRQGLAALLVDSGVAREVLHAGSQAEALSVLAANPDTDTVLLDLRLPDSDGLGAVTALSGVAPTTPIIIVSASEDPLDVRRAMDMGALGYVPKSASPETVISAVRLVLSGSIYVPPLVLDESSPAQGPARRAKLLTPRQIEILAAIAGGGSNRDIGTLFGLSEKTVKAHISAIFRTLGVASRTQAVSAAQAAGIRPRSVPSSASTPAPDAEDW
ncbi:response regulator transcription factor [Phenylobacterium sp.]|jgi:DNA-binding NarL/FixJ family response regulator|uniref:response regulator transcription factor n=1 Tax=Phenylobacterium sp. TaxID=1871053 RepID=UPI002F405C1D